MTDNDGLNVTPRQLEDIRRRLAALPPHERAALKREYDMAVAKAHEKAYQGNIESPTALAIKSTNELQAEARLAEAKLIGEERPGEDVMLRTATLEQIFKELRAQIGPMDGARSCIYLGYCEADGELSDGVRVTQYMHGTKELACTVLADLLAKMGPAIRRQTADFEANIRGQAINESTVVQALRAERAKRKAAARAKRGES